MQAEVSRVRAASEQAAGLKLPAPEVLKVKSPFGTNAPVPRESSTVALHATGDPLEAIEGKHETEARVGLVTAVSALVPSPLLGAWSESPP